MEKKERITGILAETYAWHIVVVGCGGTGSNLVPHLSQLVYSIINKPNNRPKEYVYITLADEDIIEPGNIGRQLFIEPEVGESKASVLQKRYGNAFGLDIDYYPHYIREEEALIKLLTSKVGKFNGRYRALPILVSCVDNHFSRQIFHKVFNQMDNLIYLDAGNTLHAGQVVMGMKYEGEVLLQPVAEYYPDVLTTEDEISVGGTCTRKVIKEPQSLVANMWAATTLLSFLNNIMCEKVLPSSMATFNAHNVILRPEYIKN